MNLQHFQNKYKSRQPWDFSKSPIKIAYIDEDKMHQEAPGKSDIRIHTDLLTFLAYQVDHIVEFGTREGESTIAFLTANPKSLISVDINPTILTSDLDTLTNWQFKLSNSIDPNLYIGEPDLLFIDSSHEFEHVKLELRLHAHKVKKWIVFHDSCSCMNVKMAIECFLEDNNQWKKVYESYINHGMIILQRTNKYNNPKGLIDQANVKSSGIVERVGTYNEKNNSICR